jgi:asparagine synthetase B (glutamine-hydrolysing)
MAHGLELRSPFLDKEFMELTAQMPSGLKMRGDNKKYIIKKNCRPVSAGESSQPNEKNISTFHWIVGSGEI